MGFIQENVGFNGIYVGFYNFIPVTPAYPACVARFLDVLHMHFLFFCIGFNVPFNTFQVISGRCLLVTEGMITTL